MPERVPLTNEEQAMEKFGFNMRDDEEQIFAKCEGCGELYLMDKYDEGFCQDCIKKGV